MEGILLDTMFDLPSLEGVEEVVISRKWSRAPPGCCTSTPTEPATRRHRMQTSRPDWDLKSNSVASNARWAGLLLNRGMNGREIVFGELQAYLTPARLYPPNTSEPAPFVQIRRLRNPGSGPDLALMSLAGETFRSCPDLSTPLRLRIRGP